MSGHTRDEGQERAWTARASRAGLPDEQALLDAATGYDDFGAGSWSDFRAARARYLRRPGTGGGRRPRARGKA